MREGLRNINVWNDEKKALFAEIMRLLTDDRGALERFEALLKDPDSYYENHVNGYEEKFFNPNETEDEICWQELATELYRAGCLQYLDWDPDFEPWEPELRKIPGMEKYLGWLPEKGSGPERMKVLNGHLREENLVLAAIDIDSESYPLILITPALLREVNTLAESAGHRIVPAECLFEGQPIGGSET